MFCRTSRYILKLHYRLVFVKGTGFVLCKVKLNLIYICQAWKCGSTANPRDKILEFSWTAPVVQDKFCFNTANDDVVNEALICNYVAQIHPFLCSAQHRCLASKDVTTCVRLAPWLLLPLTASLSIVTFSHAFCMCLSPRYCNLCLTENYFWSAPLRPVALSFSVSEWLNCWVLLCF
jgi:hypothetical protein